MIKEVFNCVTGKPDPSYSNNVKIKMVLKQSVSLKWGSS